MLWMLCCALRTRRPRRVLRAMPPPSPVSALPIPERCHLLLLVMRASCNSRRATCITSALAGESTAACKRPLLAVGPGTSFVLAALGLLCLLALPSTWQDPALPLLLAAHSLSLLAAALCCWLEVSDTWWVACSVW